MTLIASVGGVFCLDKPSGMTSNRALQQVKRLIGVKKAGHTGTLDPLASGLLPICLGEATKFAQYLLAADKTYQVTLKLGERTDSGDATGHLIEARPLGPMTLEKLMQRLQQFSGEIVQTPPMYSALKYQGQPLYKLARQGIEVARPTRTVHIYQLTLLAWRADHLVLQVHCSKGTYIRSLVEDLGKQLGCGAHVTALRRLSVAHLNLAGSQTLEALAEKGLCAHAVMDLGEMLSRYETVRLTDDQLTQLYQGKGLRLPQLETIGLVTVRTLSDQVLGMGVVDETKQLKVKRLFSQAARNALSE